MAECWTDWMDRDNPTGTGDWETVSDLKTEYPKTMCPNATAIEVASVDGISLNDAGNVFHVNDHITGLICKNADQEKCFCRDYKVRFLCHPPYCADLQHMCWTLWFDLDNPGGYGDWETLTELWKEHPGQICANPIAIKSRTVDTDTPATITGQDFSHYSPTVGFVCKNGPNQRCQNYKVRFRCPCVFGKLALEKDDSVSIRDP
ncbi:uncharacterized protein LOC143110324 [Alosa pseudoharengus]|uniref:uncharacterized protein LOC143110324 n=1 Tax=Alosa pseudoharengus TaxID=34774 RepID=UPI003F8BEF5D